MPVYECLSAVYSCLEEPGYHLRPEAATALWEDTNEFVQHYAWLTKDSLAKGICRYNATFKLHWLVHLAWFAQWLHPRATWTYALEDLCGRDKRLAIACIRGTPSVQLARKVLDQYRVALHCRVVW